MNRLTGYIHRSGKSKKTGNDYDFYELSFITPYPSTFAADTVGDSAFTVTCVPQVFKDAAISADSVGHLFNLGFDRFGRLSGLSPA